MTPADTTLPVIETPLRNGEAGRLCVQRLVRRRAKKGNMIQIESINVCFNTGEHMTMNTNEVMLYAKGGELIGHAAIEEYRDFLRDNLADVRLAHNMGEDEAV